MPSSVGHALAGYAIARLAGRKLRTGWPYVVAATAPDLDVVVSAVRNRPIDYRHRRSHTVGSALATGVAFGGVSWVGGRGFLAAATTGIAAYATHLALDYLGKDVQDGLPYLWPFSDRRFATPRPLFGTIYSRRGRFFSGLLTRRNLRKIGREVLILSPAVAAAGILGKRMSR